MGNMYIGLTDYDWFNNLKDANYEEVNFWRPGSTVFRALEPNDLFLFKLKKPYYAIVGGGFFVKYSELPLSLAWEAFGKKNGTNDFMEFSKVIQKYREKNSINVLSPYIGCIILTEPFFFDFKDWINPPADWSPNSVVGKNYDNQIGEGKRIYLEVCSRLQENKIIKENNHEVFEVRYQKYQAKHRLGQGAFRILVTDAYRRRCAISGEKTLPVLEAAHIIPYSEEGPHIIQNGVLLRSDIHKLFDEGYITITPDYTVEVSHRLKEDYGNGKIYYNYHRQKLTVIPENISELPRQDYLDWHNKNKFLC